MTIRPAEQKALDLLVANLKRHFGPRLVNIYLFGSKARGDDHADSDVDVLIVLSGGIEDQKRAEVSDMVFDVLDSCGIFLQVIAISDKDFDQPRGQLRWLTSFVREEGKILC